MQALHLFHSQTPVRFEINAQQQLSENCFLLCISGFEEQSLWFAEVVQLIVFHRVHTEKLDSLIQTRTSLDNPSQIFASLLERQHFFSSLKSVIFSVYFLWKTNEADCQPRGWADSAHSSPLPLEIFLHCVTCHSKAFKGKAELCTLRSVKLFSGLAWFLFNHTESSVHIRKTASIQSLYFSPLHYVWMSGFGWILI